MGPLTASRNNLGGGGGMTRHPLWGSPGCCCIPPRLGVPRVCVCPTWGSLGCPPLWGSPKPPCPAHSGDPQRGPPIIKVSRPSPCCPYVYQSAPPPQSQVPPLVSPAPSHLLPTGDGVAAALASAGGRGHTTTAGNAMQWPRQSPCNVLVLFAPRLRACSDATLHPSAAVAPPTCATSRATSLSHRS